MTNAFNRFQTLVGFNSTEVVTITVLNGNGTSQATTLSGSEVTIKGESVTVGNKAYVRDGAIVRQAPNHSVVQVTI